MKHSIASLSFAIAAAFALAAAPAFAHTAVLKTNIADKAHLANAPADFNVTLEHEASLVSVKLTDFAGTDIALSYTPTRNRAKTFSVPLPQLGDGSYKLAWKIMAADGHVMDGAVSFMIMKH